jgi:UDP-glucuronate 4-epimerase
MNADSRASYIVTGCAGFIGSHVTEALLARGDRVVGIDNFDDFYNPIVKEQNLARARAHRGFTLIRGDIRVDQVLDSAFNEPNIAAVIHLAARAGVRPSLQKPILYDDVNVVGTTRILEAVRRFGIPHLVQASSSSVYGAESVAPFSEDQPADRPVSPYASTKRSNELACHAYNHLYGFSVSCLRFFTVYGPRQRPEMAIHKFTDQIWNGKPLSVYGDGSSRRDYTYISDIVAGVLAATDRPNGYRVYNLGTTDTTSLSRLLEMLGERLQRPVIRQITENQPGDVPLTFADISRSQRELGYRPKTSLAEGLDSFVEWYLSSREPSVDLARVAV